MEITGGRKDEIIKHFMEQIVKKFLSEPSLKTNPGGISEQNKGLRNLKTNFQNDFSRTL